MGFGKSPKHSSENEDYECMDLGFAEASTTATSSKLEETTYSQKRHLKIIKQKQLSKNKSSRQNIEEALDTPIPSSNKGYKLLKLMSKNQAPSNLVPKQQLTEPIKPILKYDKKGIGFGFMKEEKTLAAKTFIEKSSNNYLKNKANEFLLNSLSSKLSEARTACEQLDIENKRENNPLWDIYSYKNIVLKEDREKIIRICKLEKESGVEHMRQKLDDILFYLRNEHYYCIYCGQKYENSTEIESMCPGKDEDDH